MLDFFLVHGFALEGKSIFSISWITLYQAKVELSYETLNTQHSILKKNDNGLKKESHQGCRDFQNFSKVPCRRLYAGPRKQNNLGGTAKRSQLKLEDSKSIITVTPGSLY